MPAEVDRYADQYFTGTQASVFFGDVFIDECTAIQFHATQSIIPIYGYASRFWDAVGVGKVLVQGVFEINFVDEGYLWAVLDKLATDREITNPQPRGRADVLADQIELLRDVTQEAPAPPGEARPGELTDPRAISRRESFARVLQDLSNLSIVEADNLASDLNRRRDLQPNRNVIYRTVPFRLTGYFGNPEVYGKDQGTYKELKDCFLVSNEMIIGSNDEVVGERYSFICRMHE